MRVLVGLTAAVVLLMAAGIAAAAPQVATVPAFGVRITSCCKSILAVPCRHVELP